MKPAPPVTKVRISAFGILARMRRAVAVLALALLAGGTAATQAPAQEDGVYFDDPDSPGGKEYSIPHERTRRENGGSGGGGENPESRGESPRFGVGIDSGEEGSSDGAAGSTGGDSGSGGGDSGDGGKSGDRDSGGTSGDEVTGGTSGGSSGAEAVQYKSTSSSSGTSPELTVSAIALGVLVAGAGLGLVLRRRRDDPST
jgi:hypothetical protein